MRDGGIPLELVDAVTNNLQEDHDRDSLLACSLVCRAWLPSSQRHLFRRVTFTLDDDDFERQAQALLSSPHLVNYIRELKVQLHADHWDANWEASKRACRATDQTLPVVLRKLSKLQSLELRKLDWDALTVDLRQSLQRVFLLPSITSLTLNIGHAGSMVDFLQDSLTREDQEENEERLRLDLHVRKHISTLNLISNLPAWVGWFVGPRSPMEVSHVQTLRVHQLDNDDAETLNRLLSAIGSSLTHLKIFVPYQPNPSRLLGPPFDLSLEFNPNLRFLRLTNINIVDFGAGTDSAFRLTWLLHFLSKIDPSNILEHIQLHVIIDAYDFRSTCSSVSGWGQVDCVLAGRGKFPRLQRLDIDLWASADEEDPDFAMLDDIAQCMANAHPLLAAQDVSVDVQCGFEDPHWWREELNILK